MGSVVPEAGGTEAGGAAGAQRRFRAVFMRGGTSKGLFFGAGVLPDDPAERDRVLIRAIGGGDPYGSEIDGLGGATSSTSKAVIVSPSDRAGYDVDYLFAQVGITAAAVDWTGSCGNLAAAVGPFAIEEGLVAATGSLTSVRIWQQNTSKAIVAHVPTQDGRVVTHGDFRIDGVPYPAAKIRLDFVDPGGSMTGRLLPSGNVVDELEVPGVGSVTATLIDAANPCVFVAASDLGCTGTELPSQLNGDGKVLARFEAIRTSAAVAMGLAASVEEATRHHPANPKVAMVTAPCSHRAAGGRRIGQTDVELVVRMLSMGRVHHALPGTGGVAVAIATLVPGTVPFRAAAKPAEGLVRIGHSSGVILVSADVGYAGDGWVARRATVWRSARRLMEGSVLVPAG
jgi:2-methylaconitate isomerase